MTHPTDVLVGNRIRDLRRFRGMSQQKLAKCVGIKFQQIQKYEKGTNRVSASRLMAIAQALNAKISYFFDEIGENASTGRNDITEIFARRETGELLQIFYEVPEKERNSVLNLLRSLAGE